MDKYKIELYNRKIKRLSLAELLKLQDALKRLLSMALTNRVNIPSPTVGICHNWTALLGYGGYIGDAIDLVSYFAASWPDSNSPGSDVCYPVKSDYHFQPWEGPNLAMRISLMRYILKRLKDIIRRRQKAKQPTYNHAA